MDEDDVLDLLREVEDPDLGDDIVSLGLVNDVEFDGDESVHISLALGAPYSPNETAIADEVREVLGAEGLDVSLSARVDEDIPADEQVFPNVENV
ncbi:MAG TPA: iron-sulfur cluster assembly protein, partial [Natronoarchaeum rubrum]|nr:iron-sulfur cluster assembly protein [Natronoarchaeum rubrum]